MSAEKESSRKPAKLNRRTFMHLGVFAAAAPVLVGARAASAAGAAAPQSAFAQQNSSTGADVYETSIADLQAAMTAKQLTAREIVLAYMARIKAFDQSGSNVRSVLELNPDALEIAAALDKERSSSGPRGPLHGIPILLKDNIDTADKMLTTAGSLAIVGTRPAQDATLAQKLRDAGAIILGKANLSEWANFRGFQSSSGWSGRGRQTRNPYVLDRNPCGSSSGSAAAVAASFAAAALGTETDGSIVCPSHNCGVVGIKPTVGLTSRAGVIPIAHSQDTVGPHGRTVADAAAVLGALTGVDARDSATAESAGKFYTDYTQFLDPNGLRGARIGVARQVFFGYSPEADKIIEAAIATIKALGAIVIDPADIPTAQEIATGPSEFEVLLYEFKADLNAYLATRVPNAAHANVPVLCTLAQIIAFNEQIAANELPYFGHEIMELAQEKGPLTEQAYLDALATNRRLGGKDGIDAVMDQFQLDAIIAPTGQPSWPIDLVNGDHFLGASSSPAAIAGYPLVTVPAGYSFGLPVGITFMGRAYSEPTLIKLAYAFEQATKVRKPPQFLPTLALP
jgi:amidase